ncbi:unnamed protein product [Symbiodinium natans]|uniref:DNA polymerase beta-like N-terminal domain-containing protein n=1 Tax=Symbiodinium natans TaxID=878477 RepID=A0A812JR96_9DINO|nr:unnamed protein product [Symbiodinium natans]
MAFNKVSATAVLANCGRNFARLGGEGAWCKLKVTAGKSVASLPGIGKESVKKIDQYLETGQIEKLEKYRNGEE